MQKKRYGGVTVRCENGRELELDYWLLIDRTCWGESYGISVSDGEGQEITCRYVTPCREQMEELMERLMTYEVTSATAADVIHDFLGEWAEKKRMY